MPCRVVLCVTLSGQCLLAVKRAMAAPFASRVGCNANRHSSTVLGCSPNCGTHQYCEFARLQFGVQRLQEGIDVVEAFAQPYLLVLLVEGDRSRHIELAGVEELEGGARGHRAASWRALTGGRGSRGHGA